MSDKKEKTDKVSLLITTIIVNKKIAEPKKIRLFFWGMREWKKTFERIGKTEKSKKFII